MCQVSGLFPYEQQTTNNIYVVSNNCLAVLGKNVYKLLIAKAMVAVLNCVALLRRSFKIIYC